MRSLQRQLPPRTMATAVSFTLGPALPVQSTAALLCPIYVQGGVGDLTFWVRKMPALPLRRVFLAAAERRRLRAGSSGAARARGAAGPRSAARAGRGGAGWRGCSCPTRPRTRGPRGQSPCAARLMRPDGCSSEPCPWEGGPRSPPQGSASHSRSRLAERPWFAGGSGPWTGLPPEQTLPGRGGRRGHASEGHAGL